MLIVIEGCMGAGKTTVARGLAAWRRSQLLLEDFENNPFLRSFYEDTVDNAIETEFAFLLLHFHQLKNQLHEAEQSELIADFHLGKDLLYADLNLKDGRASRAFGQLYEVFSERIPPPALLVYLSASTDLLVRRIAERKRDFELDIDPHYCAGVNKAYEDFFLAYSGRKLRIPMDNWDFVRDSSLYSQLSALVDRELDINA
jgi:deoxyadenosine/deoxycytidine kinase